MSGARWPPLPAGKDAGENSFSPDGKVAGIGGATCAARACLPVPGPRLCVSLPPPSNARRALFELCILELAFAKGAAFNAPAPTLCEAPYCRLQPRHAAHGLPFFPAKANPSRPTHLKRDVAELAAGLHVELTLPAGPEGAAGAAARAAVGVGPTRRIPCVAGQRIKRQSHDHIDANQHFHWN